MAEEEPRKIHWEPGYKQAIKEGHLKKDNGDGYTGWKVGIAWLKNQIQEYESRQAEVADPEEYSYMVFVVTRDKKSLDKYKEEKIIDPEKHRLWIRAFHSPESMAEEFPPIQWP